MTASGCLMGTANGASLGSCDSVSTTPEGLHCPTYPNSSTRKELRVPPPIHLPPSPKPGWEGQPGRGRRGVCWVGGDGGHPLGPGRGAAALKLLSWVSPSQQVPALIAKAVPTVNAMNYALGSEMVHRGIWQCLSPQRRERSREQ